LHCSFGSIDPSLIIMSQSAKMSRQLDLPALFKQFMTLPHVATARFLPSVNHGLTSSQSTVPSFPPVQLVSQTKDILLDESRNFQSTLHWMDGGYKRVGGVVQVTDVGSVMSPSRKKTFVIRTAAGKGGNGNGNGNGAAVPNYVFDIVDSDPSSDTCGRVLHTLTGTNLVHGKIIGTSHFGGINWNGEEDAIVYMAEPKPEERRQANFFPSPEEEEKQQAAIAKGEAIYPTKGTEMEMKEEWGEAHKGIIQPRPFVVRFTEADGIRLHTVKGIPDGLSAGQAIWSGWKESKYREQKEAEKADSASSSSSAESTDSTPSRIFDEGLYLTVFPHHPSGARKLGIAAYNTRSSKVCYLAAKHIIDKKAEEAEKKAKEKAETAEKEAAEAERKAKGMTLSPEQEAAQKVEEYKKKHAETLAAKKKNHLVVLTPDDHSAQSPRLDGYNPPQLVYLTTDRVWHHIACSALKTFITLPSALKMLVKLADQAGMDEKAGEGEEKAATYDEEKKDDSASGASPIEPFPDSPAFHVSESVSPCAYPSNAHTMIPIVHQPESVHAFPGLWPPALELPPASRFVFDGSHVLLTSCWRSQICVLLCGDEDDSLAKLPLPTDAAPESSMRLLDCQRDTGMLIVGVSCLHQPETLYVAHMKLLEDDDVVEVGQDYLPVPLVHKDGSEQDPDLAGLPEEEAQMDQNVAQIKYTLLQAAQWPLHPQAKSRLAKCKTEIIQIQPPENDSKYPDGNPQLPFEAVLFTPHINRSKGESAMPPLVLFPHGGPHSVSTTIFTRQYAYFVAAGLSFLFVNYRGSIGFGQTALSTLPGKCGAQDVKDCMLALETVLSRTGKEQVASRSNVSVQGGSHGGFLTTHLIGQYPDVFKTAVSRNPVCNIAHMIATSDIPDWSYFEVFGEEYDPKSMPTAEQYHRMFMASPIAHIAKVRTPLLMLVGGADKRVPLSQANDYVKLLRSRGVRTRTLLYPDGQHPIADKVSMEGDVWANMVMWALQRFDGDDLSLLGSDEAEQNTPSATSS